MIDRKEYIFIGRFGEKVREGDHPENNSYTQVLNYLQNLKKEVNPEDVVIAHKENNYYPRHGHTEAFGLPLPCEDSINQAIDFVRQRQCDENYNKLKQIERKLKKFKEAIESFEKAGGNLDIVLSLNNLKKTLTDEIMFDRCYGDKEEPTMNGPDLNTTHYPVIIEHFTKLTNRLAKHPTTITKAEIDKSSENLNQKLSGNSLGDKLKAAMAGVFSTIAGIVIGAVIGGVLGGGVGAIPGAIAGGIVGLSGGSLAGFLTRKHTKELIETRDKSFYFYEPIQNNSQSNLGMFGAKKLAQPQEHAKNTFEAIKNTLVKY